MTIKMTIPPEYEDEKDTWTQTGYLCFCCKKYQNQLLQVQVFLAFGVEVPDCVIFIMLEWSFIQYKELLVEIKKKKIYIWLL